MDEPAPDLTLQPTEEALQRLIDVNPAVFYNFACRTTYQDLENLINQFPDLGRDRAPALESLRTALILIHHIKHKYNADLDLKLYAAESGQKALDLVRRTVANARTKAKVERRFYDIRNDTRKLKAELATKEQEYEAVVEMAQKDGLTKTYNRAYFDQKLDKEVAEANKRCRPLTLILFDINNFKHVNDGRGHPAGDYVLSELSRVCDSLTPDKAKDTLARIGGDEFAYLLPEVSEQAAEQFANRVLETVQHHEFIYKGRRIPVSLSLGVKRHWPGENAEKFRTRTDKCFYAAQYLGKSCVITETMLTEMLRNNPANRAVIQNELDIDNEEMRTHYLEDTNEQL
jgi:diguanylate cyclase (GGDEF)-like protein